MDNEKNDKNTKYLEETIDQLTDESQFYFLGVLEALNFAQNEIETPVTVTEEVCQ